MARIQLLGLYLLAAAALVARADEPAGTTTTPSMDPSGGDPSLELQPGELFNNQTMETGEMDASGCHLRAMDLCYAGLLSAGAKPLPENAHELEQRCDELKLAQVCMAAYNKRCSSRQDMSSLMTLIAGLQQQQRQTASLLPEQLQSLGADALNGTRPMDLASLCQPDERQRHQVQEARARLFRLGRCVNGRLEQLKPCLGDLKVALQLYYEHERRLPVRPTCCAMSRFRHCAERAFDQFCGLSSWAQLEESVGALTGSSGRMMTNAMARACRGADQWQSAYCQELLPPPGMAAPSRRGRKASKLARALDLLSMGT